jgi:thioredoxin 1
MKIEVLKFYADWCGPCKALSQRLEGEKDITEINIEQNHETAIKYKIRNIPALVFLKDDKEVHRTIGLITKYEYDLILKELNDDKDVVVNDIEVQDPEIVTNLKKEK